MQLLRIIRGSGRSARSESGLSILETLVALAIISAIGVTLLSSIATTSKAFIVADEQTTAESLARLQMETAKKATYVSGATSYTAAAVPGSADYTGYTANIIAAALNYPDDGIQKITVSVNRTSRELIRLESYKVNR